MTKPPPLNARRPAAAASAACSPGSSRAGSSAASPSFALVYIYYDARASFININVVHEMPKASILYDYQGKPFSRFFEENRIAMPADQPVPKLLAEAVVAKEDHRFYEHGGVDWYGTARALVRRPAPSRRQPAGRQQHHAAARAQQHRADGTHL